MPLFLSIDGKVHNPSHWELIKIVEKEIVEKEIAGETNRKKLQQFSVVARTWKRSTVLRKFTTKEEAIQFVNTLSSLLYAIKL